jgi:transcriptional regulator with XRE-family HTH domain
MASNNRTPKARALGGMLRSAREERDIGLRRFAKELGRDAGLVSRWETGDRVPKPTDVAQILTKLGVSGARYDEILDFSYSAGDAQWLAISLPDQRRMMRAVIEFESTASAVVEVSPLLVPGALQATGYIRAIMTAGGVPEDQIEDRIAARIRRRDNLLCSNQVPLLVLVGEAGIRQLIGDRLVMVEQLRYLQRLARLPNVDLRVIPLDNGWHPALEGPFTIIESEATVVHIENRRSGLFLHEHKDVEVYRQAVDMIGRVALGAPESALFIAAEVDRMEYTDDPVA